MKRLTAIIFLLIFLSALPSCSADREYVPCSELVRAMTAAEIGLPSGSYYFHEAERGSEEYLSPSLLSALMGGGSYPEAAEAWADCAFFLSLGEHPCEFAVILCQSRDGAKDTATLLLARLSAIRQTKTSPEYSDILESAGVTVYRNYALLIISSDRKNAFKVFKKALSTL